MTQTLYFHLYDGILKKKKKKLANLNREECPGNPSKPALPAPSSSAQSRPGQQSPQSSWVRSAPAQIGHSSVLVRSQF